MFDVCPLKASLSNIRKVRARFTGNASYYRCYCTEINATIGLSRGPADAITKREDTYSGA
jgi:hypothetical protein